MKNLVQFAVDWRPVIVRGGVLVGLAALTVLSSELDEITNDMLAEMTYLDAIKIALRSVIASLVALRAFMDSSLTTHAPKRSEPAP